MAPDRAGMPTRMDQIATLTTRRTSSIMAMMTLQGKAIIRKIMIKISQYIHTLILIIKLIEGCAYTCSMTLPALKIEQP